MEFPSGKVKDTEIYPSRDTQHVYMAEHEQQRRSRNAWCKVLTKQIDQQTHTEGKWSMFVPCLQKLPVVFDISKPSLLSHPSMGSGSRAPGNCCNATMILMMFSAQTISSVAPPHCKTEVARRTTPIPSGFVLSFEPRCPEVVPRIFLQGIIE